MSDRKGSKSKRRRRGTGHLVPIEEQRYGRGGPEPRTGARADAADVTRVNTASLRLPSEVVTEGRYKDSSGSNRVVLVIVTLMLLFIAVVAWLIASGG